MLYIYQYSKGIFKVGTFIRSIIVFAAGIMLPACAFATDVYVCSIKEKGNSGWIPKFVVIGHNEGSKEATVSDPIIRYYLDEDSLVAKVVADNAKRITFVWELRDFSNSTKQFVSEFEYRATIVKRTNKITLKSEPFGYSNNFFGIGKCEIKQE